MGKELIQLIYISRTDQLAEGDLGAILAASRRNNPRHNITGVLFFNSCFFLQVLEGPQEHVEHIYKLITHDPRHRDCTLLTQVPIDQHHFANWSMAYVSIDHLTLEHSNTFGLDQFETLQKLSGDQLLKFVQFLSDHCNNSSC
uniref:BLUF domain-containing protein n=1 Tax=Magnetococcus massalia (strain MO-1) TaxID=451514 RepID=A0A1S7LIB2_MAGMO|nr:conserved protein of unknown function(Include BLUF domain) [Candidatus Magnetococcus massalia]